MKPITRADCIDGPRPCPWLKCRYNLLNEAHQTNGKHKVDLAGETCYLDIVDDSPGGMTLDRVARLEGVTKERVRQLEIKALRSFYFAIIEGLTWRDLDADLGSKDSALGWTYPLPIEWCKKETA
jgi:hypothetical protein